MKFPQLKRIGVPILICLAFLWLNACGNANSQTAGNNKAVPETAKSGNQAAPETAKTGSQAASDANKPKELQKITIAEPARTLAFAPVYAAISKGFFEKEGIQVNIVSGGGGNQTLAILLSGDAQLTAATPITLYTLLEKKQDILAVSAFNKGLPFQTVMTNQFFEKKGIKPDAPLKDKIAALKGTTIGAITLGSAQEIYIKSEMLYGGLRPDDVKVTVIGDPAATLVAMKQGIIDGTIINPPLAQNAEAKNIGKAFINGSEFKEFDGMDSQWLFGLRKWIEKNPATTKSVVKALAQGIAFVREHPEEAAKAIQPFFQGIEENILAKSLKDINFTYQGNGSMSEESMRKALKPLLDLSDISKIKTKFDTKENGFWTNGYISK